MLRKLSKSDCGLNERANVNNLSNCLWLFRHKRTVANLSIPWTSSGNTITLTSTPFSLRALAYYEHLRQLVSYET